MAKQFILTRIAPTPSGYLHLGNAYSFALTAAIAKQTGAETLLRIDDLDRDRTETAYVNDIFDTLDFLGIDWQQGPRKFNDYQNQWSQLHRRDIYQPALDALQQSGEVFACSCSRKQLQTIGFSCNCISLNLPLTTPGVAWRVVTDNRVLTVNTLSQGVINLALPTEMKNFIVKKKDGNPAYQLTSLIDDIHFGVDLIIRGDDLWPSTLAQHYLACVLNMPSFSQKTFYHHQLLLADQQTKLSKSAGSTSIQHLRKQGMSPQQVYNQIGRMLSPAAEVFKWQDLSHNF